MIAAEKLRRVYTTRSTKGAYGARLQIRNDEVNKKGWKGFYKKFCEIIHPLVDLPLTSR